MDSLKWRLRPADDRIVTAFDANSAGSQALLHGGSGSASRGAQPASPYAAEPEPHPPVLEGLGPRPGRLVRRICLPVWRICLAVGAAGIVAYFLLPPGPGRQHVYNLLGAGCIVAIVAGIRLHRPTRAATWYLFLGGQALFVSADVIWNTYEGFLHRPAPFPSAADGLYLAGYPLLVAGLLALVPRRSQTRGGDLLDGVLVATGLGVLSWVFLTVPFAADPRLTGMQKAVAVAYPFMDIVLLAVAARVAFSGARGSFAYRCLAASLLAFLLADTAYSILSLAGDYHSGHFVDAAWLGSYVLWGVAALHPSMASVSPDAAEDRPALTLRRLALLAGVSLVGPVTLLIEELRGGGRSAPVIAVGSAAISILVIARMAGLLRQVAWLEHQASARQIRLQAAALEAAANVIVITDRDGIIEYVNPAFTQSTGFPAEEAIGRHLGMLHPVVQQQHIYDELWRTIASGRPWRGELINARKDGSVYTEEQTITPILDAEGHITNFVAVKSDITERKRQEARLSYLAQHDPLTGLLNRNALGQHVAKAVASARRGRPGALMYLDLDQFKVVNDSLGHAAGDRLLVTLAGLLQANVREADTLARLGGDEFALLVSDVTPEQALKIAEKLRRLVADFRFTEAGKVFDVDVSIGVAPIDGSATEGELLAQADIACYAAKARGRNRVEGYRPEEGERQRLTSDAQWSVTLKDALRDDRFLLYFQPIVDIPEGKVRHYEALVRMVAPDGQLIPPGAFIPAAERFGLVHEIDRWVIRAAFRRLRQEQAVGRDLSIAINLSGLSFHDDRALRFVKDELSEQNVDPRRVTFEITETAAITNIAQARRFIEALRGMGCNFALDDFGSGFSSFAYLRYLPVDFVKIDGAFVRQLPDDGVNQVMVRSINDAAHSMGIGTIAEFVEDERVLSTLRQIGVDYAQGYHLGHPSPDIA